ncbi:MAG: hypothetical protein WCP39_06245 [Chlamydiota bacterium]
MATNLGIFHFNGMDWNITATNTKGLPNDSLIVLFLSTLKAADTPRKTPLTNTEAFTIEFQETAPATTTTSPTPSSPKQHTVTIHQGTTTISLKGKDIQIVDATKENLPTKKSSTTVDSMIQTANRQPSPTKPASNQLLETIQKIPFIFANIFPSSQQAPTPMPVPAPAPTSTSSSPTSAKPNAENTLLTTLERILVPYPSATSSSDTPQKKIVRKLTTYGISDPTKKNNLINELNACNSTLKAEALDNDIANAIIAALQKATLISATQHTDLQQWKDAVAPPTVPPPSASSSSSPTSSPPPHKKN